MDRKWDSEDTLILSAIIAVLLFLLAIVVGTTIGVSNGNTERRKSIEACVSHDKRWDGSNGSCNT